MQLLILFNHFKQPVVAAKKPMPHLWWTLVCCLQGRSGDNLFGEYGPSDNLLALREWGFINRAIVKVVLLEPVWVIMAAGGQHCVALASMLL